MKSKEEIKAALKSWMISTVRSTQKKTAMEGFDYHPSDISFAFRSKLGIRMNESFVVKALGMKKRNSEDRMRG